MKKLFFIFFILSALPFTMKGQAADAQLGAQYYQSGDYDKAVVYYEKLYDKQPIDVYYNYYLNCLIYTKDFKKAEKLVKKNSVKNPGSLIYHVDLGRVYQAETDTTKANKEFQAGVDAITSSVSTNAVIELANAFLGINQVDLAIKTYLQGRKVLGSVYNFNTELADVYALKKDYQSMVDEYLSMLATNDAYRADVQKKLQAKLDADPDNVIGDILKKELLKRAQKEPDKEIWSEMLVWYYLQQ
ncbi:MAG TPA: hypothetical protein VL651_03350, partial [Bacteroidia bacterium]|nr:hypothetical protein [Bacteroidia bacterium]